jgi:hypothetical protein
VLESQIACLDLGITKQCKKMAVLQSNIIRKELSHLSVQKNTEKQKAK